MLVVTLLDLCPGQETTVQAFWQVGQPGVIPRGQGHLVILVQADGKEKEWVDNVLCGLGALHTEAGESFSWTGEQARFIATNLHN